MDQHLRSDVEKVLSGMLFHPRDHAHLSDVGFKTAGDISPACGMLKSKYIRVTSSSHNGFVFLYHLAFQLCVVSKDARDKEKHRLIGVFEAAIRDDAKVDFTDLFGFCS